MRRDLVHRLGRVPPLAILAIGWVAIIAYAFPGIMSLDSFEQLFESRSGIYSDGHPPALQAMWSIVETVVRGPFGMLALQTAAFLGGVYLVLAKTLRPRRAAVVACLVAVFPPVLAPMGVVWKDAPMAGFLVLGAGALLDPRRAIRVAGLGALCLATMVRYNAPAATLPLVVLVFEWNPLHRWWKRYAIAVAAWLALTATAFVVNAALTDRATYLWYSSIAVMDIVGVLRWVPDDIPDAELRRELAGTPLVVTDHIHATARARYKPWDFLHLAEGANRMFDMPSSDPTVVVPAPQRAAIARAWRSLVFGHPAAYLRHRWATFRELLGLTPRLPWATVFLHRHQNPHKMARAGIDRYRYGFQDVTGMLVMWTDKRTVLFLPIIYLVISLALLPMCRRQRDAFALLASGLAMESSLFFIAPTPDYRYSHWMVVCTCVAAVILFVHRLRAGISATDTARSLAAGAHAPDRPTRVASP